jgi:hypothetical protein
VRRVLRVEGKFSKRCRGGVERRQLALKGVIGSGLETEGWAERCAGNKSP